MNTLLLLGLGEPHDSRRMMGALRRQAVFVFATYC